VCLTAKLYVLNVKHVHPSVERLTILEYARRRLESKRTPPVTGVTEGAGLLILYKGTEAVFSGRSNRISSREL
jgi:hypothetical protein